MWIFFDDVSLNDININLFPCRKDKPEKKKKEAKEGKEKRVKDAKAKEVQELDDELDGWKKVVHKEDAAKPLFDARVEITGEVVFI